MSLSQRGTSREVKFGKEQGSRGHWFLLRSLGQREKAGREGGADVWRPELASQGMGLLLLWLQEMLLKPE